MHISEHDTHRVMCLSTVPVSFESLSIHGNTDVSNNWLLIFELLGKCPVTHDESDRMF